MQPWVSKANLPSTTASIFFWAKAGVIEGTNSTVKNMPIRYNYFKKHYLEQEIWTNNN